MEPDIGGKLNIHANCVAIAGRGLLITGPSGSGKSTLSLEMMALGAALVADDRTIVQAQDQTLIATCPPALNNMIEARGIGILKAQNLESCKICAVLDLGQTETLRLPLHRSVILLGISLPLLHKPQTGHFAAAILHYLRQERVS
ncbi:MAG: HPr kinase/phosphatase C-terminal domain-containing protein [Rhodobacteraceae bacterium]|nr:HPr kinase/phosphatase C-terminal domain-containing protein [Paracoccaceae bacterium]